MQVISTSQAPAAVGPYSQAILEKGFLFLSGQIPLVPETGLLVSENIHDQAEQVMKNISAVCLAADASIDKIVKCTIFLTDMNHFNTVNEVYKKYFYNHKPARSTIQVAGLPRGALIEIEAIVSV